MLEQANCRVSFDVLDAHEPRDLFLAARAGTFFAYRRVARADDRALRRQFCLALQRLNDQIDHRRDLMRFRRAARHIVIDRHDLIERFHDRVKFGDAQLTFRRAPFGLRARGLAVVRGRRRKCGLDQRLETREIRERGDAALVRTRAERDQDFRFLP